MGSITQAATTSFKAELLQALHNFGAAGNTFKIALFVSAPSGTYGSATTNYSNMGSDENTGTGYTAGGLSLSNSGVSSGGTTAFTSFANASWAASTISSLGALIYNSTNGNRASLVLSFGSIISSSAGTFTVQFPSNDQNNAIIRIS